MSFTRKQQGPFRVLVDRAWQRHCTAHAVPLQGRTAAKDSWYREQLEIATGKRSSTQLNPTRDFDKAMAHFEAIAAESIDWQLAEGDGDARRILHAVAAATGEHNLDAGYIARVARQAYGTDDLSRLTEEQLGKLQQMLIIDCRRRNRRGDNPRTTKRRQPAPSRTHQPTLNQPRRLTMADIDSPF